jgi:hypothetical protein
VCTIVLKLHTLALFFCYCGGRIGAMRIYIPPGVSNLLGPVFKRAREEARPKLNQADLAARITALGLPMDRSKISRIENRKHSITDIEQIYFCKALRISPLRLWQLLMHEMRSIPKYSDFAAEDDELEIRVAEDDPYDPGVY